MKIKNINTKLLFLAILSSIVGTSYSAYSSYFLSQDLNIERKISSESSLNHLPEYGPVMIYRSTSTRALNHTFKIQSYNLENVFESNVAELNREERELIHKKRLGSARVIKRFNPDLLVAIEIENIKALEDYSRKYLEGKYKALLIEGNDPRGIDVGLLVKKSLPLEIEWRSQKNYIYNHKKIFSRDLPIGLIYEKKSNGTRSEKPLFAILATHYKSKRTDENSSDKEGNRLRAEQVQATVELVKKLENEFQNKLPLIIAGDFNDTISSKSPIFSPLFNYGLKDTLHLVNHTKTYYTHFYFNSDGFANFQQIDAILFNGLGGRVLESKVLENLDPLFNEVKHPHSYEERESLPSDHLSIGTVFQF